MDVSISSITVHTKACCERPLFRVDALAETMG